MSLAKRNRLHRKVELLALQDPMTIVSHFTLFNCGRDHLLRVVNVEEIRVQHRLHNTREHSNRIKERRRLHKIPIQPIRNIQRAIDPQRKQIMRRNRLRLARPLQHKQLRQDRHALQPDTEGPQDLGDRVLVGEEDGHDGGEGEEVLHLEGVVVRVVRGLVVVEHEVDDVDGRADEEDLEGCVVEGGGQVEGPEEVEVARDVDGEVEELRFEGYACCALLVVEEYVSDCVLVLLPPLVHEVKMPHTLELLILCIKMKILNKCAKSAVAQTLVQILKPDTIPKPYRII